MSFPSHSLNPKACLAEARTCGSRFRFMWINIFCFNGTNFIARNDARQMQNRRNGMQSERVHFSRFIKNPLKELIAFYC